MSQDVYKQLARKLDSMPNRYPATESGVEIRLLEKIFTPQEASLAAVMDSRKEPASLIAGKANIPEGEAVHPAAPLQSKPATGPSV